MCAQLATCLKSTLMVGAILSGLFAAGLPASAQRESVLYSFCAQPNCEDGASPAAGLIMDSKENLYGTTGLGGAYGNGSVFKLDSKGAETVIHSFGSGSDGALPGGSLIQDAHGDIYSTTFVGGTHGCKIQTHNPLGCGTVFKINSEGREKVLHRFVQNKASGSNPAAGLVMDGVGNLYGTTEYGGTDDAGTVFTVNRDGRVITLHSFATNGIDGTNPMAALTIDSSGNLYGTTLYGGAGTSCGTVGCGIVFEISPDGSETILHTFGSNDGDGNHPGGNLLMDSSGNLYGTTYDGGAYPYGTVFEISADDTYTILYSFGGVFEDGWFPNGGLIMDSSGNLYGTTSAGGHADVCLGGCGTVFKIAPDGAETILYNFQGFATSDGYGPNGGLIMDAKGHLYGTTGFGGANQEGIVFIVRP